MATQRGVGIVFGTGTLTSTLTGMGALNLIQSWDVNQTSDKEEVRDIDGDVAQVSYYNERKQANLEFVVSSGTTASATLASALSPGTTLALTNAAAAVISDTWMVSEGGCQITASNTGALRARVALENYMANGVPA